MSEELALLVDAVQDYAIFFLDPTGEIRTWNLGAARIMGYPAEEIIGQNFSKFYLPVDLANRKPQNELEIAEAEGRVEDEGWRVRRDGVRFWANTVITALRDQQGKLVGFAKVTRDLTERRNAEERVRQSEELFRLLVSSVKDYAIFMLDPTGHIATWNAGAHRIKGYNADEIIGKHFSTFYPEEDIRDGKPERELRIAREQGSVEDEGWRIRKDGSRFWALVVITAVHDAAGKLRGFAKVTRDITDRKRADEMRQSLFEQREARLQAEEERRKVEASYAAAQEANRAKDEFLMTLSHELRTPMTAILGWSRLLPTLPAGDPMVKEAIASIGRSAELQAQLIDDVLDVSRIISGKLRLNRESMDVSRLLRGSVESVRVMAQGRGVALVGKFPEDLGTIVADPTRIQQVVWNLLTNAIKFTPKGGIVTLSGRRAASKFEICVADTGEGIDPEFLPHMFEAFRQAENPRTRIHGGLGLGLSIVRYLTEAHGGTVTAESGGRGRGTSVCVTLPITAMEPAAVEQQTRRQTTPQAIDPDKLAGMSLLVVDDDKESREFLCAVLKHAGAKVTEAASAEAAIEQLQMYRPTMVLTDIAMPVVDGFELVRQIRALEGGDKIKVVALSAFTAGTTQSDTGDFDTYLTKPIDPAYLVDAVATAARR